MLDEPIDVDTARAAQQTLLSGSTQLIDNATWSKGVHTFQFGGNLRRITTFHKRDDKLIGSLTTPVAAIGAAGKMLIEVGYVSRFARHLLQNVNLNSAPYFFKDKKSGQRFSQAFDAVAAQLRSGASPFAVTPQPWFENQLNLAGTPFESLGPTRFLALGFTSDFITGNLNNLWNLGIDFLTPTPYNNQQSLDLFVRTSQGRSNYHAQLDLSMGKTTKIGERMRFDLAFDFFNIFNHVNFADPVLNLNNPSNFGVIINQVTPGLANNFYKPRAIQVGGRFEF